ncbi:protein SERAC1 [Cladorrhinum sp. PSN259]|nr:protein SERAC1 [Cladorrhinum sp. PSN259]
MNAENLEKSRANAKKGVSGLHVVFEPPVSEPSDVSGRSAEIIDVVFVHGLNGHCWETWQHLDKNNNNNNNNKRSRWRKGAGEEVFWPLDLLPAKIKNARIMTFQYDSKVLCNKSTATLSDTAKSLLTQLQTRRKLLKSEGPIVFVTHSLGGIVTKQVMLEANHKINQLWHDIGSATKGIVFFGTPHRGSDLATAFASVQKIASVGWTVSRFLQLLEAHSDDLREVSDEFRHVASKYALISFYEQHIHPGVRDLIVDKHSSRMGIPHEQTMMIGGDHTGMCRFAQEDPRFDTVWMAIQAATKAPVGRSDLHM